MFATTLLTLCLFVPTLAFDGCTVRFDRRSCHHRMLNGVLVTCDGQGTEYTVPQNLPQHTVYLSLSNFRLSHLTKQHFQKFSKVECLSIIDSEVKEIDPDTFTDMGALMELSLQNTQLRSEGLAFVNDNNFKAILLTVSGSPHLHRIHFRPSKNLMHLKTLKLYNNGLVEVKRDIFPELVNLEHLDLSHNKLQHLDWDWLKDLPQLKELDLDHNLLQTIPQSMYGLFFAVKRLNLAGNRFHCNCNLHWLAEFYVNAVDKTLDKDQVECRSPTHTAITQLQLKEFKCSRPSQPLVTYVQRDDYRYEVNCTSKGDPAPSLTLTLSDGRTVVSPPPPDLSQNKPVTPQILTEPGTVYCEASNSEGKSQTTEGLPHTLQLTSGSRRVHGSVGLIGLLLAGWIYRMS